MYIRFIQYGYIQLNIHTRTFYILSICKLACIEECEPTSIICFKSQGTIFPYQSLGDSDPAGAGEAWSNLGRSTSSSRWRPGVHFFYCTCNVFKGRKCHLRRWATTKLQFFFCGGVLFWNFEEGVSTVSIFCLGTLQHRKPRGLLHPEYHDWIRWISPIVSESSDITGSLWFLVIQSMLWLVVKVGGWLVKVGGWWWRLVVTYSKHFSQVMISFIGDFSRILNHQPWAPINHMAERKYLEVNQVMRKLEPPNLPFQLGNLDFPKCPSESLFLVGKR